MATGDAAASAGMAVVPGTADRRDGYIEINRTRDYLADAKVAVEEATPAMSEGTIVKRSAEGGRISIGDAQIGENALNLQTGDVRYLRLATGGVIAGPTRVEDNFRATGSIVTEVKITSEGGAQFEGAWSNSITGTRRSVFMDEGGNLGYESSTARLKKNIAPWVGLTDEQFAALSVVTFQWRDNVDPGDHVELGLIAEAVHDLGLPWFVLYDDQGRPAGIHYERVALAVIPYVQTLAARIAALEGN